jgi:GT2 family glycosyltransferase/serine/threonine protein kinase/tetratricopeptide (TPR) repeat protein
MNLKLPKDGVLYDQPNQYARPSGLELGAETLVHGYQEFRLTAQTIEPLPQDGLLTRKRQLLTPIFDTDFLKGKTLLDLGANAGFFSFWGRQRGAKSVVALDMDENYIGLIRQAQAHYGLTDIRTASCRVQDWEEPADVVLAFALIHWLYSCTANYGSLDAAVGKLRSLTKELLVIEWVAPDDAALASFKHTDWNPSVVKDSYCLKAFEAALRKHFARAEVFGQTSNSRVLYVAWCHAEKTTIVEEELPSLAPAERVISSRCLAEIQDKKYNSRAYLGEDGQSILKQASGDLAWRDAEFLRQLDGPHFPRVLEARQENGWSMAVFERIAGRDLMQVIPEIAANPPTLARFFAECIDILAALQVAKITHRDVQPQNILVRDGHPVLFDFGWAITPHEPYFAPSDLGGGGRSPEDAFCDVYSMGKVFAVCAPVNHPFFAPLISAMTAVDPAQRITGTAALRKILHDLTLPHAWQSAPIFLTDIPKPKVGFLTVDPKVTACAYLRLTAPLNHLHAHWEIEQLSVCDLINGQLKIDQALLRQAQVVVVQRGLAAFLPYHVLRQAIPNPAVKIIFELDDALTVLPRNHVAFAYFQSVRPHLEEYLKNADLVTVSTPKLKELYSHFNDNIAVLPNTVDANVWLRPVPTSPRAGKLRILFSGTVTHEHDLALVEPAMERIIAEFPQQVEFLFWGNSPATLAKHSQVKTVAGYMPNYIDYASRLKTLGVDLALVPLEVTAFNQSKSAIKWLEYSACKIPAIFTDIAAYRGVVEHGKTGWLVPNTSEAWYEAMKKLIQDESLRRSLAENAYQEVLARHTLRQNAHLWLEAYQQVLSLPPQTKRLSAPQAAIIIPTFNNLKLTRQCLDSILGNTPQGLYEIVVVDNGSTDGTPAYLKQEEAAGRIRTVLLTRNRGFAHACNQGSLAARNRYLVFLNNDTEVQSGWLNALLAAVKRPGAGVVGAKLLYPDGRVQHAGIGFINGVPDHPYRYASSDAAEVNRYRELDMVTGACFMMAKDLFHRLAGFDESYLNGVEDTDFCLRTRAAGLTVAYEPKAVVIHHEGQSQGRFHHVNANLTLFFKRWGKQFDDQWRFLAPQPSQTIPAAQSCFLPSSPIRLSWTGSFLDHGSLSQVNRELTGALKSFSTIQLSRVNNGGTVAPGFESLANELVKNTPTAPAVTVRHGWPPDWRRPPQGKLVVIQPWEFGVLPEAWVKSSADVDEFWVPSEYVRRVYVDSGVASEKVAVVPNGVNAEKFHPQVAPLPLATQKKFKFLFVGGTIFRKGPDLLLRAYLENFTAADDVCLVIKDFGGQSVYAGQTLESQIKAAQARPGAPEILFLNEELPADAMPGLYAACDCLVHPYRGEGFGLPVLEAMACGLPVIVTGGGATDDFAGDEHAYRIPSRRQPIGPEISGMKLMRNGWLLEPDLTALAEKMKWVATHATEAREKGRAASDYVRREWTWQRAAQIAAHRLHALSLHSQASANALTPHPAAKAVTKPSPLVLPETAKVGQLAHARELLRKQDFRAAWNHCLTALTLRPFHCEAYLLLAEIARAAGDMSQARHCAERARQLAPNWKPARKFLKSIPAHGGKSVAWPSLPEVPKNPRLTVCLITKNEENFLEQCLQSVRDVAHQIIVVDTGSTDRTVEIAKKFNAQVHSFPWNDDFSAARNEALRHATGDWVLSLDADEELLPEHHATLLREMQAPEALGYRLPIIDKGREREGRNHVPRLFRNAPGLFFVGRIHEQVFSSLAARGEEWGLTSVIGQTALLHHGYQKEVMVSRDKVARNLRLLQLALEDMPGDTNLLMNLGLEEVRSGHLKAGLDQYIEALNGMSKLPRHQIIPEVREALLSQLTVHLLADKDFVKVIEVFNSPAAHAGTLTASHHFGLGLACMELQRPAEGAEHMRQCLATRSQPALTQVNPDILGSGPQHCLALCLMTLQQKETAGKAFADALREDATSRPLRFDFARYQLDIGQPVEALKLLNTLAAEDPKEARVWEFGGQIAMSRPDFLEFACDWTGTALQHFPEHPAFLAQRAEALFLTQNFAGAHALWGRVRSSHPARPLAALVLCEFLTGDCLRKIAPADEVLVSREAVKWYRQLIASGARPAVSKLGQRIEAIRRVLPGFAHVWDAAHAQARGNNQEPINRQPFGNERRPEAVPPETVAA